MADYRIERSNKQVRDFNLVQDPFSNVILNTPNERHLESPQGDFVLSSEGDLAVATGTEAISQTVLWELRTYPGDYLDDPAVGVGMNDFIGLPNTENTRTRIRDRLLSRLGEAEIGAPLESIEVLQFDEDTAIVSIIIITIDGNIALNYMYNINDGKIERLDGAEE